MAAKPKYASPTLELRIGEEEWAKATASASGGCLIADAIKRQYPQFRKVAVDMATIRVTDPKRGVRLMYLTPPLAQHLLLAFDQGWSQPTEELTIRRAVKITPVTNSKSRVAARQKRRGELEAKETAGAELTRDEKASLTKLRSLPDRPTRRGNAEANREGVVAGGTPSVQGPAHPNLLRGYDRHYGAKMAAPGLAFQEAVAQAAEEIIAKRDQADREK